MVTLRFFKFVLILTAGLVGVDYCGQGRQAGAPQPNTQSQTSPKASEPELQERPSNASSQDRLAIPDIEGCKPNNVTVYSGKILFFKQGKSGATITIRTDWKTTKRLYYSAERSSDITFELNGNIISKDDWNKAVQHNKNLRSNMRANVFVCRSGDQATVRIIDLEPPKTQP